MVYRTNPSAAIRAQGEGNKVSALREYAGWLNVFAYTIPLIQRPLHHVLVINYQTVET